MSARPDGPVIAEDLCSIDGCSNRHRARGWCATHYTRWSKSGDPNKVIGHVYPPVEDRFWAKVNKTSSCWLWTGSTNAEGYGSFAGAEKRLVKAHRFAFELLIGPIPKRYRDLDHLCRVRNCVNPWRLEPVTHAENQRRMGAAQRSCRRAGHDWSDPENVYTRPDGRRYCAECRRINRRMTEAD